jgi:hypothetical protein
VRATPLAFGRSRPKPRGPGLKFQRRKASERAKTSFDFLHALSRQRREKIEREDRCEDVFVPFEGLREALRTVQDLIAFIKPDWLQSISEEDAKAEGVEPFPHDPEGDCWTDGKHRTAFEYLWGEIHGFPGEKRGVGKSWIENPWLWCVSFRRVQS